MFFHRTRSYSQNWCFKEVAFFQQKKLPQAPIVCLCGVDIWPIEWRTWPHIWGVFFQREGCRKFVKIGGTLPSKPRSFNQSCTVHWYVRTWDLSCFLSLILLSKHKNKQISWPKSNLSLAFTTHCCRGRFWIQIKAHRWKIQVMGILFIEMYNVYCMLGGGWDTMCL